MYLTQLKYFQTVAKHQNMTHAAEELYVSQPALSKMISNLEKELGVSLFDRDGKKIKLNRFGEIFLKHVDLALSELKDAEKELYDLQHDGKNDVIIAANNISPFPMLLKEYHKSNPDTVFHHITAEINEMKNLLLCGDIDFCISSPPIYDKEIKIISLANEELFLIVPHDHKYAKQNSIDLIDACDEPFITLKEGYGLRKTFDKIFDAAGFQPNIIFETDIASSIFNLIDAGLGIAILPILPWDITQKSGVKYIRINSPICKREVALSYNIKHYLSGYAIDFRDFILNYYGIIL